MTETISSQRKSHSDTQKQEIMLVLLEPVKSTHNKIVLNCKKTCGK